MNEALKEIANKYEVTEERIPEILTGMKVKNLDKPTKRQLEGFEKACALIKEGKETSDAIAIVIEEAKNGTKDSQVDSPLENGELDKFIVEQAMRAAEVTLLSLPQVGFEERERIRTLFINAYRARLAECLQDPEYKRQFFALLEGQEAGKLRLSSNTDSTIALLNSSSTSS